MKNNVKKVLFGYDSENLAENSKVDNYAEQLPTKYLMTDKPKQKKQ